MILQCLNYFQQVGSNKYSTSSSKGCVIEFDLEYPQ